MIVTTTDRELRLVLSVEECRDLLPELRAPQADDPLRNEIYDAALEVIKKATAAAQERQLQAEADAKAAESCPIKVGMQVTSDMHGVDGWYEARQIQALGVKGAFRVLGVRLRANGKPGSRDRWFYHTEAGLRWRPAGTKDEKDPRGLKEIAAAIQGHFTRIAEAPGETRFSGARCWHDVGPRIKYRIGHWAGFKPSTLSRGEALRYLAKLDAGEVGSPWDLR